MSIETVDLVCDMEEMGFCGDLDLEKGASEPDGEAKKDSPWMMWGFASTPKRDVQEESVIQKGLNTDPLTTGGWVNWDHDRRQLIGVPKLAEVREHPMSGKEGLYVEYQLLKSLPMAKQVRAIAKALKVENIERRLGLSLEGKKRKVSRRGVILKADILGIAVTPYPVNTDTSTTILMKGMLFPTADDIPTFETFAPAEVLALHKAVATGHDIGGTTQTGAGASRREEIDCKKNLGVLHLDPRDFDHYYATLPEGHKKAYKELEEVARLRDGTLTKGEAALWFTLLGFDLDKVLTHVGLGE